MRDIDHHDRGQVLPQPLGMRHNDEDMFHRIANKL